MKSHCPLVLRRTLAIFMSLWATAVSAGEDPTTIRAVEPQPLLASMQRLVEAMDYVGNPLPKSVTSQLKRLSPAEDAARVTKRVQQLLDPFCLATVSLKETGPPLVQAGAARQGAQLCKSFTDT